MPSTVLAKAQRAGIIIEKIATSTINPSGVTLTMRNWRVGVFGWMLVGVL